MTTTPRLPEPPYPDVTRVLPHREPFLFLDCVVELAARRVVGVKTFTGDEPFFQGHFPGEPIVPGVLLLEGLAQAMAYHTRVLRPEARAFLMGVEHARFRKMVQPGTEVRFEVDLGEERFGMLAGEGRVKVAGQVVADATLKGFSGEPGLLGG